MNAHIFARIRFRSSVRARKCASQMVFVLLHRCWLRAQTESERRISSARKCLNRRREQNAVLRLGVIMAAL